MSFGHYEFIILPFGLTNSLGVFSSLMNGVFRDYLDKFIQVSINDILIYSQTMEERDENLCLVLQCWQEEEQEVVGTKKCAEVIQRFKEFLTMTPILKVPDMNANFLACTDASKEGLGVLMQDS
jgi:hypothetical protein